MALSEHELREAIRQLDEEAAGEAFTDAQRARWNELNEELEEHRARRARLQELVARGSVESEMEIPSTRRYRPAPVPSRLQESRSAALRAIDRHTDVMSDRAATTLEELVERDVSGPAGGVDARYLAAAGDPDYAGAFGRMLADPQTAHLKMTSGEQEALHRANRALEERALAEGTTTAGGFALPIGIDPTILLTSNGALNPIRSVANVRQMTTHELRLVTSAGVSASFAAEATEVSDNSPTLAQPILYAEKAHAFVQFSIELQQDWASLAQEMAGLFADAKDVLESSKFLTGAGHASNEPQGLLTGATVTVTTATTAVYAIADVYSLLQAIPARFQANTTWLSSPTILDTTYRLTPSGSTAEPQIMASRGDGVLGRRTLEWSDMATATTTGSSIVAAGDVFRAFQIGDRIGATAEIVPHMFSTANHRPTGERGIYFYWRVASAVAVPQALRVLKVR